MQVVRYAMGKLLLAAGACLAVAIGGVAFYDGELGFKSILLLLCAPIGAIGAVLLLARAVGSREALRFDGVNLRVTGLLGAKEVRWSEVIGIELQRVTTHGLFGLVKTSQSDSIMIQVHGGLTGAKKLLVRASLLELGPEGSTGLLYDLDRARDGAAPARPSHDPVSDADDVFDADAALARYMARRASEPEAAPVPVRPSFGRKVA